MFKKVSILVWLIIVWINCYSQNSNTDTLNQFDENNLKVGQWIYHWEGTNVISSVQYYLKGKRNGLCIYYNEKGIIQNASEYLDDKLHGISKVYSPTGALREIAEFKDDKKEGFIRYYNYKNQLVEELEYHNNMRKGIYRTFYESGRIASETTYKDGKENGTRRTFKDSDTKEVILETDFVNDMRVERRYYKKGKVDKVEKEVPSEKKKSIER